MKQIHPTQAKLLNLLKKHINNPLSINRLSEEAEIDSPGLFYHHLRQLEKKGYLKRNPTNARDYVVLDAPDDKIVYIGKYGMAQCGPDGRILGDYPEEHIPIASSLIRFPAAEAFIVEANGNSMEPKIKKGDIIIARKQNTADHGDIIVCVHQLKALIKQFVKTNMGFLLLSSNGNDPIPVTENDGFRIEGVVKHILKYD